LKLLLVDYWQKNEFSKLPPKLSSDGTTFLIETVPDFWCSMRKRTSLSLTKVAFCNVMQTDFD